MSKNEMTYIRFTPEEKKRLAEESKARGISLSELIRERVLFAPRLYSRIEEYINMMAEGTGAPPYLIVENTLISVIAERSARMDMLGPIPSRLLPEFAVNDRGFLRGDDLFDHLYNLRIDEFEAKRERDLLFAEEAGVPLSEEDSAFLMYRRAGKSWLESPESEAERLERANILAHAKEARDMKLVPEGMNISDVELGNLWLLVRREKLSESGFRDQLASMLRTNPERYAAPENEWET